MRHAISKNLREFVAVILMIFIALGVGGYILSNQRFYLPAWVPVLGTDFFELKAQFSTAQVGHARPGPDGRRSRACRWGRSSASSWWTAARW